MTEAAMPPFCFAGSREIATLRVMALCPDQNTLPPARHMG
jgi:hypothetical protein